MPNHSKWSNYSPVVYNTAPLVLVNSDPEIMKNIRKLTHDLPDSSDPKGKLLDKAFTTGITDGNYFISVLNTAKTEALANWANDASSSDVKKQAAANKKIHEINEAFNALQSMVLVQAGTAQSERDRIASQILKANNVTLSGASISAEFNNLKGKIYGPTVTKSRLRDDGLIRMNNVFRPSFLMGQNQSGKKTVAAEDWTKDPRSSSEKALELAAVALAAFGKSAEVRLDPPAFDPEKLTNPEKHRKTKRDTPQALKARMQNYKEQYEDIVAALYTNGQRLPSDQEPYFSDLLKNRNKNINAAVTNRAQHAAAGLAASTNTIEAFKLSPVPNPQPAPPQPTPDPLPPNLSPRPS